MKSMFENKPEIIAKHLHDAYEQYSKNAGWKTQKKCKVKFKDLPQENQIVMISIARLIRIWNEEDVNIRLKKLRQGNKITIKRYDDAYGYDLDEEYFKL